MDEVTRDVLASTTSVLQCSNGTNGSTPTELTKDDIDAAVQTLLNNDAEMISEIIVGRDAFGKVSAEVKPNLIDLEAYGVSYGDRGEPFEDAERLNGLAA